MGQSTDTDLVRAYRAGGRDAFAELVARHLRTVFRAAYRVVGNRADADDVTQETFVKAWRSLGSFDDRQPFRPWLLRIARNAAIDCVRARRTMPFAALDEGAAARADAMPDARPNAATVLDQQVTNAVVRRAVRTLSPDVRAVLHHAYEDEWTFREIGDNTRKPLNTVKSQHRRALARLRALLATE